ncbi:LysM peptidoglycan-binding domain-containing protein [Rhizobium sp. 'Codium 1']|uniref:LysM peptidoglycan-binding domain-containing protein n=1 Tax=Rhizobium sp. 'Codium 1' TaxID=2940484 RepID=UPI001E4E130A|nr:LysM domain-containing protein [Rhizobium sp. 'Codium 1']MCC8932269.1 LysM peptidoglycan-binding domain-containing protein [Rhizobium sp. 'Codium 1']
MKTVRKLLQGFLAINLVWSNGAAAQTDACMEPIDFKPTVSSSIPVENVRFAFRPLTREVCLPKKGGGCTPKTEIRVGMTIASVVAGSTFQSFVDKGIRESLTKEGYLPEHNGLDTSIGAIRSSPASKDDLRTDFGFHAEKWGSMTGFCCKGFSCRRCEWKTRLWERTTNIDIDSSQKISADQTTVSFATVNVDVEDTPTWLEFLAGLGLAGAIVPQFAWLGLAFTDMAIDEIMQNIEDGIGKPSAPLPGQSVSEYLKAYFGADEVSAYYWPRLELILNAMVIDSPTTGFQLAPPWGYQLSKTTKDDAKGLFEYADFCAAIRPVLEQKVGAADYFKPLDPMVVETSGNFEQQHTIAVGENVWRLARDFYKNEQLFRFVIKTNGLNSEAIIQPGDTIRMPSIEQIVNSGYLVGDRDTLWGIASELYGTGQQYQQLVKKNEIVEPDLIYPLDVLSK